MNPFQAAVLGVVQGLTEFLPISSSGHLLVVPFLFGWEPHGLAFDAALHLGTAAALLAFFWRDWLSLARVALTGLRDPKARFEEVAENGRGHWLVGDLSDRDVGERLVAETVDELGRIDVLVNNAGVTAAKPVLDLDVDDFDALFSVDVRGAFLMSSAAAKRMRDGDGGAIINITSVHEHIPRPGFALYASAKAALGMLTRSFALELAGNGIRVNAVAPGAIATPRNEEAQKLADQIPAGRAGLRFDTDRNRFRAPLPGV